MSIGEEGLGWEAGTPELLRLGSPALASRAGVFLTQLGWCG